GPIVSSARTTQFLDGEFLVAGIEEDGIHIRRHPRGLIDRLGTGHVDDLHRRNPRQSILQIAMRAESEMVTNLDRIRPAEALLLDADAADFYSWRAGRFHEGASDFS